MIISIIVVLCTPIFLFLIIALASEFCQKLEIPPIFYIVYPYEITFTDYCNIFISTTACVSSIVLGIIVYKLSKKIYNHDKSKELAIENTVLKQLYFEIASNSHEILNIKNNITDSYERISTIRFETLDIVSSMLSSDDIDQIIELYCFFISCKKDKKISNKDFNHWFTPYDDQLIEKLKKNIKEKTNESDK